MVNLEIILSIIFCVICIVGSIINIFIFNNEIITIIDFVFLLLGIIFQMLWYKKW